MLIHALRRWLARRSAAGVLGLALGLTLVLGGAQVAAFCHQLGHLGAAADPRDVHADGGHECALCLLAATIGNGATAPSAVVLHAPAVALVAPESTGRAFTPRLARAYASRAPPRPAAA